MMQRKIKKNVERKKKIKKKEKIKVEDVEEYRKIRLREKSKEKKGENRDRRCLKKNTTWHYSPQLDWKIERKK